MIVIPDKTLDIHIHTYPYVERISNPSIKIMEVKTIGLEKDSNLYRITADSLCITKRLDLATANCIIAEIQDRLKNANSKVIDVNDILEYIENGDGFKDE